MKHTIKSVIAMILMSLCVFAYAQSSPMVMMKKTSNSMIGALEGAGRLTTHSVRRIVRRILLPKMDVASLSRSVLGRRHWRESTPSQRAAFKKQFVRMVVGTYAAAFMSYDEDVVKFYPMRGDVSGRTRVRVKTVIQRKNGQRIPVSYRLVKRGKTWNVYDFSVEGVSMVQSYRSQFASVLSNGGMDALIKRLEAHNRAK